MAKMVMSLCVSYQKDAPVEKRWKVTRYAYLGDQEEGDRVRDGNYLLGIVRSLTDTNKESSWIEGKPQMPERCMFEIIVEAKNHGKANAEYSIDYKKHSGCPSELIDDGMEIYTTVKRLGIKPTMRAVKNNKKKVDLENRCRTEVDSKTAESVVAAVASQSKGFVTGAHYWAEGVDAFGHLVKTLVKIEGIIVETDGKHKVAFTSEHQYKPVVVRVNVLEDGSESFTHKNVCGVVRSRALAC